MNEIGAVVLAGGRSRRFGSDKAGHLWRGRPLLEHVLAALPAERARTVLVVRDDQAPSCSSVGEVVCDDPTLPEGPLRGIVAGLGGLRTVWAWVLACDLPGVQTRLLRALASEARPGISAVVPRWQGRLQPLCALYEVSVRGALELALREGERSVQRALSRLSIREVDEAWCRSHDPAGLSFVNVNLPGATAALDPGDSGTLPDPSSG